MVHFKSSFLVLALGALSSIVSSTAASVGIDEPSLEVRDNCPTLQEMREHVTKRLAEKGGASGWVFWTTPVSRLTARLFAMGQDDKAKNIRYTYFDDLITEDEIEKYGARCPGENDERFLNRYSAALSLEAKGHVVLLVEDKPRPESTFWKMEYGLLLANTQVQKMVQLKGPADSIDIQHEEIVVVDRSTNTVANPWASVQGLGAPPVPDLPVTSE